MVSIYVFLKFHLLIVIVFKNYPYPANRQMVINIQPVPKVVEDAITIAVSFSRTKIEKSAVQSWQENAKFVREFVVTVTAIQNSQIYLAGVKPKHTICFQKQKPDKS